MTERRAFTVALFVAILVYVPIHFLDFKGTVPHFVRIANGQTIFDRSIPDNPAELYERIERFGEDGRQEYVFRNLTTDFVLPFSLLPFFLLSLMRFNRRNNLAGLGRFLLALPIAFVGLDLVENFSVVWLIYRFPEQQEFVSMLLPLATVLKRVAVGATVLILFGGMVSAIAAKLGRPLRSPSTR
jgi:hypothetical protein